MARQRLRSALLLAVAAWLSLLGLGGCGALPPLSADQERRQAIVDGLTVTLDSPRSPEVNQAQALRLTLTDEDRQPVDGADIYLDLTMDMICLGAAAPIASPTGSGQYELTTLFPMAGDWEVTVVVTLDGKERRASFQVPVVDQAAEAASGR